MARDHIFAFAEMSTKRLFFNIMCSRVPNDTELVTVLSYRKPLVSINRAELCARHGEQSLNTSLLISNNHF